MRSALFLGEVRHTRLWPVEHRLGYPLYVFGIDLDEADALERSLWLYGHNRRRPVALYDEDYLTPGAQPIREKLSRLLDAEGLSLGTSRVVLVTSLRHLGRVFNPVSFYYVLDAIGALRCVVAEVNNTFGDRHVYVLRGGEGQPSAYPARFQAPKAFHVSPFNDLAGTYDFAFSDIDGNPLEIRIELRREDGVVFTAELSAQRHPLTRATLARTLLRHPLTAHLTMSRIYREAAKLFFVRKLSYHPRPIPTHPRTIGRRQPTLWQRLCRALILRRLERIDQGSLTLTLPEGTILTFGMAGRVPAADLMVLDHAFFPRLVQGGDIGLGESYTDGEWETPDIAAVFAVLIANRDRLADGNLATAFLARCRDRLRHWLKANTVTGSRRNIRAHYDLGNDFYRTFLDETMTYSCALFRLSDESLEEAQRNKLRAMIAKARIGPGDHVLEIGCGWGGFAIEAVRQTGCRVTGITVSAAQHDWACRRVREEGLSDHIEILLSDYRQVSGRFDRIVSIEMLEAVGHRRLGAFFRCCGSLLKPGGVMALQTITIPDERYEGYRYGTDWIRKHIFPGGHLPSPGAIRQALGGGTGLVIEETEEIGAHYVPTLREWRRRFLRHAEGGGPPVLDPAFRRKWVYYLATCEAGFASRATDDLQLVLAKQG